MNLTKRLLELLQEKNFEHDILEITVSLRNTKNIEDDIIVNGQATIPILNSMIAVNIDAFPKLYHSSIEELFKAVDEMEYYRLFHPSHYAWLNSDEYLEHKKHIDEANDYERKSNEKIEMLSKDEQIYENLSTINNLLEIKKVSVMDDLIQDIFISDETNEHLFFMQKLDDQSPLDAQIQITNYIIEKLTNLI